jgi:hypothetical protein
LIKRLGTKIRDYNKEQVPIKQNRFFFNGFAPIAIATKKIGFTLTNGMPNLILGALINQPKYNPVNN